MEKLLKALGERLAFLLLPIVVKELLKSVEQLIKIDINGDGEIG